MLNALRVVRIILTLVYCQLPCGHYVPPGYSNVEKNLERDRELFEAEGDLAAREVAEADKMM